MTQRADALYDLIVGIRAAFGALRARSDAALSDIGVTAAMRAQMEYLATHGPDTVPGIARAKRTSRQNMQKLADMLVDRGLAEFSDNPAHKRSAIVSLTAAGASLFARIRDQEAGDLAVLADQFSEEDLHLARDVLRRLTQNL